MVALQLLVVLSPAYRRPPPGTHSSRSLHHTTTWAANLISMVFRIRHPKSPEAGAPAKGKPCLEHLQPPASTPQSPPLSQRPCLSKPLPRLPRSSGMGGAHPTKAAKVLSMVFDFAAPNPLGIHLTEPKDHAYLNRYSTGDITGNTGATSTTTQHT